MKVTLKVTVIGIRQPEELRQDFNNRIVKEVTKALKDSSFHVIEVKPKSLLENDMFCVK